MGARQPFTQVDAFAERPFAGNPAAIFILARARNEEWMQLVAREMNLSETAFLVRRDDGFDLRWFTPTCEVDLCGHATLASSHALWEEGLVPRDATVRFHTRSGVLTAARHDGLTWLDFPATPSRAAPPPPDLLAGVGAPIRWSGQSAYDWLVELESEAAVRELRPDLGRLERLGGRGVIVTAASTSGEVAFVSRFFAPAAGVPEDPVTGSAHCALAPFWAARLGRDRMAARQLSPRGGRLELQLAGDRVHLGGRAVTVVRGELLA